MTSLKRLLLLLCTAMLVFSLASCKKEGTGERLGKQLDKTAEDIGKKFK